MFAKPMLLSAARRPRALTTRAAARRDRQRLERDISTYRTPSERLELESILARHRDEDTREIEAILARNTAPPQRDRRSVGVR